MNTQSTKSKHFRKKIFGYIFAVTLEQRENGYVAFCPGVGGVYEEGATIQEARRKAYEGAVAILGARMQNGDPLLENNPYLKVLTEPPSLDKLQTPKRKKQGEFIATLPALATG